jgi:hypothetical protein
MCDQDRSSNNIISSTQMQAQRFPRYELVQLETLRFTVFHCDERWRIQLQANQFLHTLICFMTLLSSPLEQGSPHLNYDCRRKMCKDVETSCSILMNLDDMASSICKNSALTSERYGNSSKKKKPWESQKILYLLHPQGRLKNRLICQLECTWPKKKPDFHYLLVSTCWGKYKSCLAHFTSVARDI